jgi:hypothetical protein
MKFGNGVLATTRDYPCNFLELKKKGIETHPVLN